MGCIAVNFLSYKIPHLTISKKKLLIPRTLFDHNKYLLFPPAELLKRMLSLLSVSKRSKVCGLFSLFIRDDFIFVSPPFSFFFI